jgi:hypothetical protein
MESVFHTNTALRIFLYAIYKYLYIKEPKKLQKKLKAVKKEITEVVALAKKYAQLIIITKVFTKFAPDFVSF